MSVDAIHKTTSIRLLTMAEEYRALKDPFGERFRGKLDVLSKTTDPTAASKMADDIIKSFEIHLLVQWSQSKKHRKYEDKTVLGPTRKPLTGFDK